MSVYLALRTYLVTCYENKCLVMCNFTHGLYLCVFFLIFNTVLESYCSKKEGVSATGGSMGNICSPKYKGRLEKPKR